MGADGFVGRKYLVIVLPHLIRLQMLFAKEDVFEVWQVGTVFEQSSVRKAETSCPKIADYGLAIGILSLCALESDQTVSRAKFMKNHLQRRLVDLILNFERIFHVVATWIAR